MRVLKVFTVIFSGIYIYIEITRFPTLFISHAVSRFQNNYRT